MDGTKTLTVKSRMGKIWSLYSCWNPTGILGPDCMLRTSTTQGENALATVSLEVTFVFILTDEAICLQHIYHNLKLLQKEHKFRFTWSNSHREYAASQMISELFC